MSTVVGRGERWATKWIVRNALRSLVKQGDRAALATLGVGGMPKVEISKIRVPRAVRVGEEVRFSFVLASTTKRRQPLVVDYIVHFVKANDATRPKVFKLNHLTLDGHASVQLGAKVYFARMTTRQHYPGAHRIELRINGVTYALGKLEVRTAGAALQAPNDQPQRAVTRTTG